MALATGLFMAFELTKRMEFVVAEASYANPLDGAAGRGEHRAAIAYRDLGRTATDLGRDGSRTHQRGRHPEGLYVLLAQPTEFDSGRNLVGVNAVWSYTHVPRGSDVDMRERVTRQIERFSPGFRDRIVGVNQVTAHGLSHYNRNYHDGDFSAGAVNLRQLFQRPTLSRDPHRTLARGVYLASSSTAPGPGVHGLNGGYVARSALPHEYGLAGPELGVG